MGVTIQVTYEMSKELGVPRFEVDGAKSVGEALERVRERFGADPEKFAKLTRVAAVAVNGVLVNHRRGMRTALADGDVVSFVKAAAGG